MNEKKNNNNDNNNEGRQTRTQNKSKERSYYSSYTPSLPVGPSRSLLNMSKSREKHWNMMIKAKQKQYKN